VAQYLLWTVKEEAKILQAVLVDLITSQKLWQPVFNICTVFCVPLE